MENMIMDYGKYVVAKNLFGLVGGGVGESFEKYQNNYKNNLHT